MGLESREQFNFKYDGGYKRRLKRKGRDIGSFSINSCKRSLNGAQKDGEVHNGVIDADYHAFLSQFGASSKLRSSVWAEDDGGDYRDRRVPKDDKCDDDTDPHYNMFLENLRENGKSYALEVVNTNGISEFIKYEALGRLDDKCELQNLTKFRNITEGEKTDTTKHSTNVSNGENIEMTKNLRSVMKGEKMESTKDSRNVQSSDKVAEQKNLGSVRLNGKDLVVEKHFRSQCTNRVSHGTKECLNKELTREENHIAEPLRKCDTEDNIIDKCYQSFLDCKQKEGNMVTNTDQRLKYGEDDVESLSDTEILVMDDAPDCGEGNFTPFVCSRVYYAPIETEGDDWQCPENPSGKSHSQFREELMGILRRPYNQDEFDELLQEVNVRKPIGGHKNLRRRIRSFSVDKCSKSYLDHYSDLKGELDVARFDRPKMLNILRGFFYWLQNLSHDGAFKPWSDPVCRALIPRVR